MRTHELAQALKELASVLKRGPNVELGEISVPTDLLGVSRGSNKRSKDDLPIALSALLSLSSVDKSEWVELVKDLGLNIEIRSRDASRDIVGKVLQLLAAQPEARDLLQSRVKSKGTSGSPELAKALSSLLND